MPIKEAHKIAVIKFKEMRIGKAVSPYPAKIAITFYICLTIKTTFIG
jgi:hypothetical protein